ncbi:MAG: tetraacyldisaccharide 4'-kinase, partial [Parvibaculum sp.]
MTDVLRERVPAHVIVLGNEKGGSGKTTTAMHVIAYLLQSGFRVGSIDLDGRQRSLTRYVENRKAWAE